MLIKDFYKLIDLSSDGSGIVATLKLNPEHKVYKGHFPNHPVVPGVIQLQIVKELLEQSLGKNLFMGNIQRVKYLKPVVPTNTSQLVFTIIIKETDEQKIGSNVSIGLKDSIFTKAKIEFTII
jgi:3-hydroxyacyl-[acyl-carrier-protein] dehydratase